MATSPIDIGEKSSVIQCRMIFKRDEFHRQTMFGLNRLFGDEPSHHGDAATDELRHLRGRQRAQLLDLLTVERQGMAAGEKAERLDLMTSLLGSGILVRDR